MKDKNGETYMIPNTAFSVGMLDLTNPAAIIWFKKILREMVDSGVRGWMADFGEGLPLDACLFNGKDIISFNIIEVFYQYIETVIQKLKSG